MTRKVEPLPPPVPDMLTPGEVAELRRRAVEATPLIDAEFDRLKVARTEEAEKADPE